MRSWSSFEALVRGQWVPLFEKLLKSIPRSLLLLGSHTLGHYAPTHTREWKQSLYPKPCKNIQNSQSDGNRQNLATPPPLAIHISCPLQFQPACYLIPLFQPLCGPAWQPALILRYTPTKKSVRHLSKCHCVVSLHQKIT